MSGYFRTLAQHAAHLSHKEFKLLAVMAAMSNTNPPEYQGGMELLAETMGYGDRSRPGNAVADDIMRLRQRGYIVTVERGDARGFARYALTFPEADYAPAEVHARHERAVTVRAAANRRAADARAVADAPMPLHTAQEAA